MLSEIIKLVFVLFLVIVLLSSKIDLWLNLILNSLFIGLLFNLGFKDILTVCKATIMDIETLKLLFIIFTIYFLSIVLEQLRKYEGMVKSLQKLILDYRFVMMFLSSFISLLPIQGGAIFSAPMIKSIGESNNANPEKNMFINYWFRHIWEFLWPLYPEIILYASLLKISIKNLIIILSPLTVISLLIGIIWVNRNLTYNRSRKEDRKTCLKSTLKEFIQNSWPILFVFLMVFLNINLLYSLLITLITLFFLHHELRGKIIEFFQETLKKSYTTLLLVFGIVLFKEMLEYAQIIEIIPNFFISKDISIYIAIMLIPFLVSFLTGSIFASIGICAPVFLGFLVNPDSTINLNQVIILYTAAYIGMMTTPLHLCLAITKDFFCINIRRFYYILILNLLVFISISLIYYIVIDRYC